MTQHYDPPFDPEDAAATVFDPTSDDFGPIMAAIQEGDYEQAATSLTVLATRYRTAQTVAEQLREHLRRQRAQLVGDIEPDGNASAGFRDSCDLYDAHAFTVETCGRTLYITVEDVTIKREED